jgi:hypothetical protein
MHHEDHVPHRIQRERGPRKHVLEYNEEKDRYVERQVAAQQARDAKALEAKKREAAKAERAKKAWFDRITTVLDLSQPEYRAMRKVNFFAQPKNTDVSNFHHKEQELIFMEIYGRLTKYKVCPQKTVDFEHLHKHAYFAEALWITEKLGLHPLMKINQDYNVALVHQFFATVVFGDGEDIPMTWMLGNDICRSSFRDFVGILGYAFVGTNIASGLRMHIEGVAYHKKTLKPLYGKLAPSAKRKEIVLGDAYGFKTHYNILLRLFHENIAPSAGNLDAIHGGLVNLLPYSHEVFVSGEEAEVEPIDVMNFIYKEMYDTMITKKKTLVYAPYVMLLIIEQHTEHPLLSTHLTTHKYVKPRRKPLRVLWKKSLLLVMMRMKRLRKKKPWRLHLGRGLASKMLAMHLCPLAVWRSRPT